MASDLRNLTVRLSMDRLNFDQGLSSVNRALSTLRGELNTTQSGMGGFASETDRLSTRMDVLQRTIQAQQEKINVLRQSYEQSLQATGENSRATQSYAAQINNAVSQLGRMEGELTQTRDQLNRLEESTNNFNSRMTEMGNKLTDAGMKIGAVFGGIALAVGGALKDAIKTGADFESEMAKVGSKAGASADQIKELSAKAQELAPLGGSASNVASAMDDLAAKGYGVNQIMAALPGILNAANASGEDLALTSDTITSALESFKMKATDTSHVADVLAQTANLTAAGMTDLQYTFKYAAPVASQLGISLEQLAGMTGLMANAGIKGEAAGTSLREAMLRLADPPKAAGNELHDLGVKTTDAQGKFRNFADIIGDLNTKTANMTNAQKASAMSTIFGTNAVSGMMTIIAAGKPKLDNFTDSLKNSDGASKKAADTMQNNLNGSLKKLSGGLDSLKIGIEQALAPALKTIVDGLTKLVTWFNNLSPSMKSFVAISLAVVAVLATIGAVIGGALAGVGAFMSAIAELGITIGAIASTAGIILGVVAGVVALGVAFYELYQHCKPVQDGINKIRDTFKGLFEGIKDIASSDASSQGKGISILDSIGLSPSAVSAVISGVNAVKSAFNTVKTTISNIITFIQGVGNMASGDPSAQGKGISMLSVLGLSSSQVSAIQTNINAVKSIINGVLNGIKGIIQTVLNGISNFWNQNGSQIMKFVSVAWNGISSLIGTIISAIKTIIMSTLSAIAQFWNAHGQQIMAIVSGYFNIIKADIQNALNIIFGIFQMIMPIISGVVQVAFALIKTYIKTFADFFSGVVQTVVKLFNGDWAGAFQTAKDTAVKIWNDITNIFKGVDLYQIGIDIMNGLINGISSMVSSVVNTISSIAGSIGDTAKKILGIHSPSRVMMEIGGYVTEGMAIGMDNNAHKVINASNRLSKNAIPNINQPSTNGGYFGSGNGGKSTVVNINTTSVNMNEEDLLRVLGRMEVLHG